MMFPMWKNVLTGLKTPMTEVRSRDWFLVVVYLLFALGVGLTTGLLHFESPSLFELFVLPVLLVLYPCLLEEVVFRGVLLPRTLLTAMPGRRFIAVTISTSLFVLMHPLNAWLVGLSDTSQFLEPSFLVIVTALGYTCGYLYLRSGSLWAPIAVHWATVVGWNLFLGRDLTV